MRQHIVVLTLCLLIAAAHVRAAELTDEELLQKAGTIVAGKVVKIDGKEPYVRLGDFRLLYMGSKPGDGGGWPRDFGFWVRDGEQIAVGQEGIWVIANEEQTRRAPRWFVGPERKAAFLESLAKWLEKRTADQMATVLVAIKKDPQVEQQATWVAVHAMCVTMYNLHDTPLYDGKPNENPYRRQLAEFYKAVGRELAVAPNPTTPDEIRRATPILKTHLYVGDILDRPADPTYRATFDQTLASYWDTKLRVVSATLGGSDIDLQGEMDRPNRLRQKDQPEPYPAGTKFTRMDVFMSRWGPDKKQQLLADQME